MLVELVVGLVGADVEVPDELEVVGADVGGVDVGALVVGAVVVLAVVVGAVVAGVFVAGVVARLVVVDRAGDVGVEAEGTRSGPGAGASWRSSRTPEAAAPTRWTPARTTRRRGRPVPSRAPH